MFLFQGERGLISRDSSNCNITLNWKNRHHSTFIPRLSLNAKKSSPIFLVQFLVLIIWLLWLTPWIVLLVLQATIAMVEDWERGYSIHTVSNGKLGVTREQGQYFSRHVYFCIIRMRIIGIWRVLCVVFFLRIQLTGDLTCSHHSAQYCDKWWLRQPMHDRLWP